MIPEGIPSVFQCRLISCSSTKGKIQIFTTPSGIGMNIRRIHEKMIESSGHNICHIHTYLYIKIFMQYMLTLNMVKMLYFINVVKMLYFMANRASLGCRNARVWRVNQTPDRATTLLPLWERTFEMTNLSAQKRRSVNGPYSLSYQVMVSMWTMSLVYSPCKGVEVWTKYVQWHDITARFKLCARWRWARDGRAQRLSYHIKCWAGRMAKLNSLLLWKLKN